MKRLPSLHKPLAALIFLLFLSLACKGVYTPHPTLPALTVPGLTLTPEESAWYACILFIQQQEDLPVSEAQRYSPEGVRSSGDRVYIVEVYYAREDDTYICEMLRYSNGDMELLELEEED